MPGDRAPRPPETPAADEHRRQGLRRRHRAEPPTPVRRGVTAALAMFAVAAAAVLATFAWARLSGAPAASAANAFVAVGGVLCVAALFAAPAVSLALPRAARGPFWSTGILCAFMTLILWGVTCGLAGAMRVGG
ncbi:MAG TPA: hypothetical protein VF541_10365 [Longimicrobium sp.]|jgi:hypothetical protein